MPDLKSELSKVINSWEAPVPTPTPTPTSTPTHTTYGRRITSNSTRITFNYVRDNPGVVRPTAIAELAKHGVNVNSSSSLIAVLVARGNLRVVNGGLFATQKEYKPLPLLKPRVKKVKEPVKEPVEAPKAPESVQINAAWDADTLLNNLSIKQARSLYDELRKIFGG